MEYAEHVFPQLLTDETGKSLRQRIEDRWERAETKGQSTKAAHYLRELETPPLPLALEYLLATFLRIRERVASDQPIDWTTIHYFMVVTRFHLLPWEVELIERLDNAFHRASLDRRRAEDKASKGPKPGSSNFRRI